MPIDLIIQRMLPKIIVPCFSDAKKHKFIQSSWNNYFDINDNYPCILVKKSWPTKLSVLLDDNGLHVLACKHHNSGEDRLNLFLPKSTCGHVLNAQQSDQLAHCVKIPRTSKHTQAKAYCAKFSVAQCRSGFSGIDAMNVTTHSDFSKMSELLSQHEDTSLVGRIDIQLLSQQKIKSRQISAELAKIFY